MRCDAMQCAVPCFALALLCSTLLCMTVSSAAPSASHASTAKIRSDSMPPPLPGNRLALSRKSTSSSGRSSRSSGSGRSSQNLSIRRAAAASHRRLKSGFSVTQAGLPAVGENAQTLAPAPVKWMYQDDDGLEQGPYDTAMISAWVDAGYFDEDTLVKRVGESTWRKLGEAKLSEANAMPAPETKQLKKKSSEAKLKEAGL